MGDWRCSWGERSEYDREILRTINNKIISVKILQKEEDGRKKELIFSMSKIKGGRKQKEKIEKMISDLLQEIIKDTKRRR